MLQIFIFQLTSKYFHVCVCKIIYIVCLLADRFVISINHRDCRFKDTCALLVLHILCSWHPVKSMYLFFFLPDKLSLLGKPPYLLRIGYTTVQNVIRIYVQSNKVSFSAQYRIIIDHKSIKWCQICNPDISQFIHVIHLVSFAINATDLRQLRIVIVLIIVLIQELHIFFDVACSIIIYRYLNWIPDKISVKCIHHIFCKVHSNTIVWFIIRLRLLVKNLVVCFIRIFQMFKPKGALCIMLCYEFIQFVVCQFFF